MSAVGTYISTVANQPAKTGGTNSQNTQTTEGPGGDGGWDAVVANSSTYQAAQNASTAGTQGGALFGTRAYGAGTTGTTRYDTSLDAAVGADDKAIAAMGQPGSYGFDQTKYDALVAKRKQDNLARWQSVLAGGSPGVGFQALQKALQSGDMTMDDLAGIDITQLGDDTTLQALVTNTVATKKAAAVAPPPTANGTPDQIAADQAAGTAAIADATSAVSTYVNTTQAGALKTFDDGVQASENGEASMGANLSRQLGGEAAGMAAGEAGANTAAQGDANRDTLLQNQKTDLESFIGTTLNNEIGDNSALATMDTADRLQAQSQAATVLTQQIDTEMKTTDAAGQAQLQDLSAAIADWQAHMDDETQSAALWNKIIKLSVGTLMAAGGGAAVATGVLAPAGGALIAGGVAMDVDGATH